MDQFWMVYRDGGKSPAIRHNYPDGAHKEAERLAIANPGQTFYILEAIQVCIFRPVEWVNLIDPNPF